MRSQEALPISSSSKAAWGCSTAFRGAPPHRRLRDLARVSACRCCSSSTLRSRNRRRPWRADSPPTTRVRIGGVVLNRAGSERHVKLVSDAIAALGIPILGAIPRTADLVLPERHLGGAGKRSMATSRRGSRGSPKSPHAIRSRRDPPARGSPSACDAGSGAHDRTADSASRSQRTRHSASSIRMLDGWRESGAEIATFSPLADEAPPIATVAGCPGATPEHAGGSPQQSDFAQPSRASPRRGRFTASAAAIWSSG